MAHVHVSSGFAVLALAVVTGAGLAFFLTGTSSPEPTHAEGSNGMSLTASGSVKCTGGAKPTTCTASPLAPFSIVVQTNNAPTGPIAGFDSYLSKGGLVYLTTDTSQATCQSEVLVEPDTICQKFLTSNNIYHSALTGSASDMNPPITNIAAGGEHESLVNLLFACPGPGASTHKVNLSGFSSHYYRVNFTEIILKSPDSIVIDCLDPAADNDQDGCTNGEELGPNPQFGGLRHPVNFWDFYDTPTGMFPNFVRNKAVAAADYNGVLSRFGTSGTATSVADALAPVTSLGTYHAAYDRSAVTGFLTGPADGAISTADFFEVLAQFGHTCVAAPN